MRDIRRIAAEHDDNHAMVALRADIIEAFERATRNGLPLSYCADITIGLVLGAMVGAVGIQRAQQVILPRMIRDMQEIMDVMASPDAQGNA